MALAIASSPILVPGSSPTAEFERLLTPMGRALVDLVDQLIGLWPSEDFVRGLARLRGHGGLEDREATNQVGRLFRHLFGVFRDKTSHSVEERATALRCIQALACIDVLKHFVIAGRPVSATASPLLLRITVDRETGAHACEGARLGVHALCSVAGDATDPMRESAAALVRELIETRAYPDIEKYARDAGGIHTPAAGPAGAGWNIADLADDEE
jgi:hypothetical protein